MPSISRALSLSEISYRNMGVLTDGAFITAKYKKIGLTDEKIPGTYGVFSWLAAAFLPISFTLSVSITVLGTGASSLIW